MRLIAVIPARNEAVTIADVAARTRRYVDQVLVVDDASTDDTAALARQVANIEVLENSSQQGKADSLWRGMLQALEQGADAVITLDADDQHRPEDIPALMRAAEAHPDAIIIAARLRGRANIPWLRRAANDLANLCVSWLAGYRIPDSQSGFRLYPAGLLRQICIPHDAQHGFVWESEVLIEAAGLGFMSQPVTVDAIYKPTTRPSHFRAVTDTARIARMLIGRLLRKCRACLPWSAATAARKH